MRRLAWTFAIVVVSLIFLVAAVAQAAPTRKIVVFNPEIVNEPAQDALIKVFGGTVLKDLPLITGKAVLLPPQIEVALGRVPGVVRIDPDVIVQAYKGPPPDKGKPPKEPEPPPEEVLPWGVNQIDADLVWDVDGDLVVDAGAITGSGIRVAVVDTGIDLDHPDLATNIAGDVNIINPKKTGDDDNGHGTHVAGTIAAVDNTEGVIGVAPAAKLYAVKVLNRKGSGWLSDVIAGLEWCVANNMQVVNMSLGTSSDIQSFHDAVMVVNDAGIVQVAAAGNAYGGAVGYPAAYPEVIAVSATDDTNTIAGFSSVGPEVELAAPGVNVFSAWKGGGYKTESGTSMAAPHVSGTSALVWAANPTLTHIQVRTKLQTTADNLGDSNLYGYGLVDAEEAATGSETSPAPRRPGISPVSKLSVTWGELKNE